MYTVPVMKVKVDNPRRNKILSFVSEKGQVSKEEFISFINMMNEEEGTKLSWAYVTTHPYFFRVRETRENGKVVELSSIGKRVLAKTAVNECETFEEVVSGSYPDLSDMLVKVLAAKNGVDISLYDITQVKLGMAMTLENNGAGAEDSKFDLFGTDMSQIFMVVVANLAKDKNYYLKLSQDEVVELWPNTEGDKEMPAEVSVDDFNELWDEIEDDDEEDDDDDDYVGKSDDDDDDDVDKLMSLACSVKEGEDNYDMSIEKIANAYMVSKSKVEKEFVLGTMIESRTSNVEEAEAKKNALSNIAENVNYYSDFARNHYDELTDEEKKIANEILSVMPNFTFPMPEPDKKDDEEGDGKKDDISTKGVEFVKQEIPGTQPEAPAANSDAPAVAESSDDEILNIGKSDPNEMPDFSKKDKREEWEQENTGKEQVLLDKDNNDTLLTKEQKREIDDYIANRGEVSEEKLKEFADKFGVEKNILRAYLDIITPVKESYEIGKRYTIDGHTGIVIAVSESHVVMSQHGKMLLVEKADKDEFDGGASEEESQYDENADKEEVVLSNKDDFANGNEMNLDSVPQFAGLTPQAVYARKAAGPSNFFHNRDQQGPKRVKSRAF